MKYCEKCKIQVVGSWKTCPLCQRPLKGEEDSLIHDPFPIIPTVYHEYNLFFRILILASISIGVIALAINFLFPSGGLWSLFVVAGIACAWVSLAIAVHKRRNIPKTILYQVVLLAVFALLWDLFTGWRGWSLDYVVPILCFGAILVMAVMIKVMKQFISDYLIYFVMDAVFGIIPVIFLLTGIINVPLPTVICVAGSIISLASLWVFSGKHLWEELKRRLHL
jgi:hypothetical protein